MDRMGERSSPRVRDGFQRMMRRITSASSTMKGVVALAGRGQRAEPILPQLALFFVNTIPHNQKSMAMAMSRWIAHRGG
jgi:hypothetical protein